ncbi:hypothetical protein V6N13_073355 [Hibiscus sabdariffa]
MAPLICFCYEMWLSGVVSPRRIITPTLFYILNPLSLSLSLSPLHLLTGFSWLCNSPSSLTVKTVWEKAWCCLVQRQFSIERRV